MVRNDYKELNYIIRMSENKGYLEGLVTGIWVMFIIGFVKASKEKSKKVSEETK